MLIKMLTFLKKSFATWIAHLAFSMCLAAVCTFNAIVFIHNPPLLFGIYTCTFFVIAQIVTFIIKSDPRKIFRDAVHQFTELENKVMYKGLNKEIKTMLRIQIDSIREEFLKKVMNTGFLFSNFYIPDNEWDRFMDYMNEMKDHSREKWEHKGIKAVYVDIYMQGLDKALDEKLYPLIKQMIYSTHGAYAGTRRGLFMKAIYKAFEDAILTFIDKIEASLRLCASCQHSERNDRKTVDGYECNFRDGEPCANHCRKETTRTGVKVNPLPPEYQDSVTAHLEKAAAENKQGVQVTTAAGVDHPCD